MTSELWVVLVAGSLLALAGTAFLWRRMPVFRWYCGRCKRVVSSGRFHPARCTCGASSLKAYFCRECRSWNTAPSSTWHCDDCGSKSVIIGVDYHLITGLWRWRNQNA